MPVFLLSGAHGAEFPGERVEPPQHPVCGDRARSPQRHHQVKAFTARSR